MKGNDEEGTKRDPKNVNHYIENIQEGAREAVKGRVKKAALYFKG